MGGKGYCDIFYRISFKRLFDYTELKRYDDLPKQTARAILVPFFVVSVQFLRHFGPS